MRRDHRRPFDIEASEAADVTQQFWGATRGWSADGDEIETAAVDHTPHSLQSLKSTITGLRCRPSQATRRVDLTGRIDRTRSHGMPRPEADEALEIARREATLGELAAGWIDDDEWPELDLTPAPAPTRPTRQVQPASRRESRVHDAFDDDDEFEAFPEDRDDRDLIPLSPVAPLASKLGLGAVDPLLARLGAIVVAGIVLLPIALSARGGSHDALADASDPVPAAATYDSASAAGSVVTSTAASQAAVSASVDGSGTVVATTAAMTAAALSADAATAAAGVGAPTPSVASDNQGETPAATTLPAADVPQSQSVATNAPAEVATVSEPAERLAPDCSVNYEAGQGDSWYRIADAAGVTPRALMDQNLAGVDTPIFPGDEICLPAGATVPQQPVVTTAPPATAAPTTAPAATAPPTTIKSTTTTQAPPPAPASTAQVQALIREIWPDELEEKALQIAWRESNYKATAFNGSCCYGVFQINWSSHKSWLAGYGITSTNDLLDARKNITVAYAIYQRAGGWGPWGG